MISKLLKRIVQCTVLSMLLANPVLAENTESMSDPIFGLQYNIKKISFDPVPVSVRRMCKGLIISRPKLWVFAKSKTDRASYFLVSGFINVYPDVEKENKSPPTLEIDSLGVIVELRGNECRSASADSVMSDDLESRSKVDKPLRINLDEIDNLYADLIQRYIKAFGGKEAFLLELRRQKFSLASLDFSVKAHLEKVFPEIVQFK
jgi:hypothetical protein